MRSLNELNHELDDVCMCIPAKNVSQTKTFLYYIFNLGLTCLLGFDRLYVRYHAKHIFANLLYDIVVTYCNLAKHFKYFFCFTCNHGLRALL